MLRTKITTSLLEVVRGFLQPLHPVLDLQIYLRFRKMVQNDSPYLKNLGLDTKTKCLAWPEAKLQLLDTQFHLGPQEGDFEEKSENFKWVKS